MNKEIEELMKQNDEAAKQIGVLTERNRIMDEIEKADLPLGVWSLIRGIIIPDSPST